MVAYGLFNDLEPIGEANRSNNPVAKGMDLRNNEVGFEISRELHRAGEEVTVESAGRAAKEKIDRSEHWTKEKVQKENQEILGPSCRPDRGEPAGRQSGGGSQGDGHSNPGGGDSGNNVTPP